MHDYVLSTESGCYTMGHTPKENLPWYLLGMTVILQAMPLKKTSHCWSQQQKSS